MTAHKPARGGGFFTPCPKSRARAQATSRFDAPVSEVNVNGERAHWQGFRIVVPVLYIHY